MDDLGEDCCFPFVSYSVVNMGPWYYFFTLKWEARGATPDVLYHGSAGVHVLPHQGTGVAEQADNSALLDKVDRGEVENVMAALYVVLTNDLSGVTVCCEQDVDVDSEVEE